MVTNPLLSLFKEQLEAECATLRKDYGLPKRGDLLMYWYFLRLHNFSDTEVAEIACDGSGDLGIDALWIDDDTFVHFYSFKNPVNPRKAFSGGDVDKTISGLKLVLNQKHDQIANSALTARLDDVYQQLPRGYRIHFVTSGEGLSRESVVKLDSFIEELKGPSGGVVSWDQQPLTKLQEGFYQQSLPAIEDPLRFDLKATPYMLRSGTAESYFFHIEGSRLGELYETHGEGLLQRNIRIDQRETPTNRSIETTCTGPQAANFLHFNNGVTFLCEKATYDPFQQAIILDKGQVVNGGQTIRAIWRVAKRTMLDSGVLVPARAITSSGDKDFANNVAVNQNNQNKVGTGFLRSNDQRVVQLDHALASRGYYLERREGELKSLTEQELEAIKQRIGHQSLADRTIKLKEGAQAYTATFYQQPEIAKKNPKKIFLSNEDGGQFERIFSTDMTAEKVIIAHKIKTFVDSFVRRFAGIRRKLQAADDVEAAYSPVIGATLAAFPDIHQVIPQCSLFICGTVYRDCVELQGNASSSIPAILEQRGNALIQEHLGLIVEYAKNNKDKADRSWPTLLKSNTFFSHISAYLSGIRKGGQLIRED